MGNNDVEPLTALELALEASYQSIRTRTRIESGAGVNAAASRLNMTFVASDRLSELVWSPHKGLSLKYTDFSFSDRNPHNCWDVGTSNMILSLSQGNSPCRTANKNPIIEENMTISQNPIIEENVTISQAGEQTQFAKSPKSSINLIPAIDPNCSHQSGQECEREVDLKLRSTSEPQQELLSNSMPLSGKDKEMEIQKIKLLSRIGGEQTVLEEEKTDMPKFSNPENSIHVINQEFTAESGLWLLNDKIGSGKKESSPPDRRNKGKEKALSGGDFNDKLLQDENDSHGSFESCNSGGLWPKGKKRWTFEHQVIVESKRAKRYPLEIPASSSIPRQNSSFMNWISNVVKGPYNCGESDALLPSSPLSIVNTGTRFGNYDQQIIASTKDPEPASRTAGFQTMFQSIYCSTPKENEKGEYNNEEEVDGSKELMQVDNSHKPSSLLKERSVASTSEVGEAPFNSENANINIVAASCAPEGVEDNVSTPERKLISWTAHKSDSLANLWISRFSPRAASVVVHNLDHQGQRPEKELECPPDQMKPIIEPPVDHLKLEQSVDKLDDDDDDRSVHHYSNAPSSPKINSEAIASVFARRLVAIKHIVPLDAEIEESEVEIRRHQTPVRLNLKLDWKISSEKRESSSDERQKLASCSGGDVLKKTTRIIRLGGSTDMKHSNVPTGVFEFIKKLRLTRADIFKWINSGKSLSKLNGYFLRLRLGKKEGEQGGTGYHVALISGEQKEGVQEGSKVSLSVVVGGARCWVESQYISNNNFLEEEFMVWWCLTMKSPENISIAEDKLQFKVEERGRLGF